MIEYIIKNLESDYEPVVGFLDLETPREEELIKDFIDQTQIEYSIQKIDPANIDDKTIGSILMYIYNTYKYELSKSEAAALEQAVKRLCD